MISTEPSTSRTPALESVPCDLCGDGRAEPVIAVRDEMLRISDEAFQVVRCSGCGLLYLNPRPTAETLPCFYAGNYAPFARSGIAARVKAHGFAREVAELWALLAPPARVLDVGCATGELLQAVRMHGNPSVVGVEPSAQAAAIAHQRWGIEVRQGSLEQASFETGSIDTALLSHVIEHLPSPSTTLAEVARIVRPGGALVLWLPNADSLATQALGHYWIGWDAPRHLYAFTPHTLRRLLADQGFTVRSIRHEWIGLEWSWGLRLWARERFDKARLDRALARLHPALTAALSPVSAVAARSGKAGRMRVVAVRQTG